MERYEKWRARCVDSGKVFWITVRSYDGTRLQAERAVRDKLGSYNIKIAVRPILNTKIVID